MEAILRGERYIDTKTGRFVYVLERGAGRSKLTVVVDSDTGYVVTTLKRRKLPTKYQKPQGLILGEGSMEDLESKLIGILRNILQSSKESDRQKHISQYQTIAWDAVRLSDDDEIDDEMSYLADVLDLYQPNEIIRRGSDALYDDKKLEEILKEFFAWYEEVCKRKGRRCAE